jgi:hypothetical protein
VHGRDDINVLRLPSAAEPRQTNMICPNNELNTTIPIADEELLLTAQIAATWDYTSEFDSTRFTVDLSPFYWIDDTEDDTNNNDDYVDILSPVQLPTYYEELSEPPETIFTITPNCALSAVDHQIRELGITKSEFYGQLRSNDSILSTDAPIRAHIDGGSMATTTDQLHCLWYYSKLRDTDSIRMLQVADNHRHRPEGTGFLRLPTSQNDTCFVRCLYTPTLPATIVSPHDVGIQHQCTGYSCTSNFNGTECCICLHFSPKTQPDLCFPLTLIRGLLFSNPVELPTKSQHTAPVPQTIPNCTEKRTMTNTSAPSVLHQLTREQLRILWHQRLGHIHPLFEGSELGRSFHSNHKL